MKSASDFPRQISSTRNRLRFRRMRGGDECAFSLVEVVSSLGLVMFSFVSLLGLLSSGLRQERNCADQIRAAHILSAVISDIEAVGRSPKGQYGQPTSVTQTPVYKVAIDGFGAKAVEGTFVVTEGATTVSTPEANSYVVHYRIEPPDSIFKTYKVRACVAWPGFSSFEGSGKDLRLLKALGKVEAVRELNRG